jgi:uncharacterized protein DUF1552
MNRWAIARRDLLKGLGVGAACLPLLHAGRARGADPRRNLIVVVQSLGYRAAAWQPAVGPFAGALPRTLSPLEPVKQHLMVLPDMTDPSVTGASGLFGYGTILYGQADVDSPAPYRQPNGPTVDQVVGGSQKNQRRSLALAVVEPFRPPAPSAAGGAYCCWAGARQPLVPLVDPLQVYTTLFGGSPVTPPDLSALKRLLLERKSILDYVGGSLGQFARRLGSEDKKIIEAHNQALRDLEVTLMSTPSATGSCGVVSPGMVDVNDRTAYPRILLAHMDMMLAALKCGITQVVTLQLCNADAKNVTVDGFVPGLPPTSTNAALSWFAAAHAPLFAGMDRKQVIDQYLMSQFATLLAKMSGTVTPDGALIDTSVVLWANTMHDGADLDSQRIPWMLGGNAGGYFKTGQCVASAGKPIGGVLTEICHAMGVTGDPFGPPMPGLRP